MFIRSMVWRATLALGAAAVAVVALAVPASAGGKGVTPEQAGYTAAWAQFKAISTSVYLRNPVQYAGEVSSYRHSVQLWPSRTAASGVVVSLGVEASTSGMGYTPYAIIYNRGTHQVIVSNPNAQWCSYRESCSPEIGSFTFGGTLELKISYSPKAGTLQMYAGSPDLGSSGYASYFTSSYTVTGQSFVRVKVGTELGSSPWDSSYSYTPPATSVRVATYNDVQLTSYSGHTGTLRSWWNHAKVIAQRSGDLVAAPTDLYNGGASFRTWLVPQSTSSSS